MCAMSCVPLYAAVLLSVAGLAPALAQQAADTTADIGRCMDIEDRSDRMRCYDALADQVRARSRPPASEEKVRSFGQDSSARVVDGEEGREELHDRIEQLKSTPTGRWIVTLASGQVWQQTVTSSYSLRKGMEVRIYPTRWGNSYRLSAQGLKGFIQVERVK
jgi:hypothetical protein